jgi:hypothetical protein
MDFSAERKVAGRSLATGQALHSLRHMRVAFASGRSLDITCSSSPDNCTISSISFVSSYSPLLSDSLSLLLRTSDEYGLQHHQLYSSGPLLVPTSSSQQEANTPYVPQYHLRPRQRS